jgi:putative membrane protein
VVLHQRDSHEVAAPRENGVAPPQKSAFVPGMRRHPWFTLLLRWGINAVGIIIAARMVPGISYEGDWGTLAIVVIVLGLFNAFLKPLLVFFALPFVVFTLGFGILIINAVLLLFADGLIPRFHVEGFTAAFFGALIISLTNVLLGRLLGDPVVQVQRRRVPPPSRPGRPRGDDDDVIDI